MTDNKTRIVLVLGGARSGKSAFAQDLAVRWGGRVLFCATAEPLDDEMRDRIEAHRRSRPVDWDTLEAARDVGPALERVSEYDIVLLDCVTLLTSNCLTEGASPGEMERAVEKEIDGLVTCIDRHRSSFIIVSNEVGGGLVPDSALARAYRDLLGRANQRLAACADEVYLMVAGLPLRVK